MSPGTSSVGVDLDDCAVAPDAGPGHEHRRAARSRLRSARCSCTKPSTALSSTTTPMTIGVLQVAERDRRAPRPPSRMTTSTLRNWSRNRRHAGRTPARGACAHPGAPRASTTDAAVRPRATLTPNAAAVSVAGVWPTRRRPPAARGSGWGNRWRGAGARSSWRPSVATGPGGCGEGDRPVPSGEGMAGAVQEGVTDPGGGRGPSPRAPTGPAVRERDLVRRSRRVLAVALAAGDAEHREGRGVG